MRDAEMEHANTSRQFSIKDSKSCSSGNSRRTKKAAVGVILADHQRRAVEGKAKLAELIAEAEFLQLEASGRK